MCIVGHWPYGRAQNCQDFQKDAAADEAQRDVTRLKNVI